MKLSVVYPLVKTNVAKTEKDLLQPISILPVISRIIEKIVTRQLVNFMSLENILLSARPKSGFCKNQRTRTALLNQFNDLIDAKDQGIYSS